MTLSALQHLLRAAQALAEDRAFLVLLRNLITGVRLNPDLFRARLDELTLPVEGLQGSHPMHIGKDRLTLIPASAIDSAPLVLAG